MPGFDDDNYGLDFDAPAQPKRRRAAPVVKEPEGDDYGLDFDAAEPEPVAAKETPNAPGVPTNEPPKPMGPPPPPQVEQRPLRTPTKPSIVDELDRSIYSAVEGASGNLMDELLGAGNYFAGKVGYRPEVSWDEAQSEAQATMRPMVRDYPWAHGAGQAALGLATAPIAGSSVAGNAALGAALAGGSEYADSRDPTRSLIAGTIGGVTSAGGTWAGNKAAKAFGLTPTEARLQALDEAAAEARFRPTPQPEPLGPLPVPDDVPRPQSMPPPQAGPVPPPPAPSVPPRPQTVPPGALAPETPLYGPFAEGPRPLDLPEQPAVPYRPEPLPPPPAPPPPDLPPGPAQDPFHGRAGELARTAPETAPPSPPTPAPAPKPPVMDELIRAPAPQAAKLAPHQWPEGLTPQERQIAETIRQVIPSIPREKNGSVFVGRLLDAFPEELREPVKAALPKLQQSGALKMSRADLAQALDPEMIAKSSIRRGPAPKAGGRDTRPEFHFIDPDALGAKAPPPSPAPADDLESLLRQSVAQGKPPRGPAPTRPQPAQRAQVAPAPKSPPTEAPLELGASVPPRPQPKWMEPAPPPEWSLEPMGAPGAGPRRATPPMDADLTPEYRLGALEEPMPARTPAPAFAEPTYQVGDVESGAREAAKYGASPRGNTGAAPWETPAPYEVGNPDLTPAPEAQWPPKAWAKEDIRAQIAIERQKARDAASNATPVGEKVADKALYGLGWVPGIGKWARIGRAGLQATQAARGTGPEDIVKIVPNKAWREGMQTVAYAGMPTLNYAIKATLTDEKNGLSPEERQKLTSASVAKDSTLLKAADYAIQQKNAAYAALREKKLKEASEGSE